MTEQLGYNLLYRYVGLSPDDTVWDATTFTKNRERSQQGEGFTRFMEKLLRQHQELEALPTPAYFQW